MVRSHIERYPLLVASSTFLAILALWVAFFAYYASWLQSGRPQRCLDCSFERKTHSQSRLFVGRLRFRRAAPAHTKATSSQAVLRVLTAQRLAATRQTYMALSTWTLS